MSRSRFAPSAGLGAALLACVIAVAAAWAQDKPGRSGLAALVPQSPAWALSEAPRSYRPDDLFEYIDGAAESYLSYDFRELIVADFAKKGADATLTLEIYDMGLPVNAFGIFAAERYPENKPVQLGDLGYVEGEALNFLAGRFYIKMLAFGLGAGTDDALREMGAKVAAGIGPGAGLPALVAAFPKDGLVARSERYISRNFMGYEFLRQGYVATYKSGGRDLEGFFIDGGTDKAAEGMLVELIDTLKADGQAVEKGAVGVHARNRYGQHLYIVRSGAVLCGAMRVPDGLETAGEGLLRALTSALAAAGPPRK
jgi:hypothetical protein